MRGKEINAFVLKALQELFLLFLEELVLGHVVRVHLVAHRVLLRKLSLQEGLLGLGGRVWADVLRAEEIQKLVRNFLKGLLRQKHRVVRKFPKRHELHYISVHVASVLLTVQRHLIGIQLVHRREVSTANAHNNNGQGQAGSSHNLVNSRLHVIDDTVGNDQQNVVLLVLLRNIHLLGHVINQLEQGAKVGRAVKVSAVDSVLVGVHDTLDAVTLRVEDITVQGEAMIGLRSVGRDRCAEAQRWDLLITVVVLQDIANRSDSVEVLVLLQVQVVER